MGQNEIAPKVTLTADQAEAADLITEWFLHLNTQIFVLCGYAGTGKTFLVDYVVRSLGLVPGESAAFVAPTGKAASVLIRNGCAASTIHSLIYTRDEEIEVNEDGEVISEHFLRFILKEKLPKEIRLIVVDETSMVSDEMLRDLLSFGVKCLFCGDPAQLPPVGGTNSLLSLPVITLKEIVRQERDNPIVALSAMLREGGFPAYGTYGENVAVASWRALPAARRKQLFLEADQIIVGSNKTRMRLNREVRSALGIPEEAKLPIDGEKLVCTLNDWEKKLDEKGDFHLVNGTVGRCYNVRAHEDGLAQLDFKADFLENFVYDLPFDTGVFTEGKYFHSYGAKACLLEDGRVVGENNLDALRRFRVRREDTVCRFEFAYAVTCHKAQGSEYDFVIVLDESRLFLDSAAWLYTAVTRAKRRLLILR